MRKRFSCRKQGVFNLAVEPEVGLEVVQEGSGTQFDEQVVQACIEVIKKDGFQFKSTF